MAVEPVTLSEHEQRLQDVVLDYLEAVDAGRPPSPAEVLARHPDLAGAPTEFFVDQERPHGLPIAMRRPSGANSDMASTVKRAHPERT